VEVQVVLVLADVGGCLAAAAAATTTVAAAAAEATVRDNSLIKIVLSDVVRGQQQINTYAGKAR
jgi:hypothetical protein